MTGVLAKKIALVTGASGGIGQALPVALAEAGCDVAIHYNSNQQAAEVTAEKVRDAGRRALLVSADLSDPTAPAGVAAQVEDELGPIDVLVPNAGYADRVTSLDQVSLEEWQRSLSVNLTSPYLLISRVIDGMAERSFGRVLLMSSVAAFTGGGVGPHYAASKAGLHGLLYWLAGRYARAGVTVNAWRPPLLLAA